MSFTRGRTIGACGTLVAAIIGTAFIGSAGQPAAVAATSGWSSPAQLAAIGDSARITAAANGNLVASWTVINNDSHLIVTRRSADWGKTWTPVTALSAPETNAESPQVAALPDSSFEALWLQGSGDGMSVVASRSTDGLNWASPTVVASGSRNSELRLVALPDKTLVAGWLSRFGVADTATVQTSRSTDSGATWSETQQLSQAGGAHELAFNSAPRGRLAVVWTRDSDGDRIVEVRRSVDSGENWGPSQLLSKAGTDAFDVQYTSSDAGGEIVVWTQQSEKVSTVQTRSTADGGRNWTDIRTLSEATGYSRDPQVVVRPDHRAVAIWSRTVRNRQVIEQRRSTDDGRNWGQPKILSTTAGVDSSEPRLVDTLSGKITAVWAQHVNAMYMGALEASQSTDGGQTWSTADQLTEPGGHVTLNQVTSLPIGALAMVWNRDGQVEASTAGQQDFEKAKAGGSPQTAAPSSVASLVQNSLGQQISLAPPNQNHSGDPVSAPITPALQPKPMPRAPTPHPSTPAPTPTPITEPATEPSSGPRHHWRWRHPRNPRPTPSHPRERPGNHGGDAPATGDVPGGGGNSGAEDRFRRPGSNVSTDRKRIRQSQSAAARERRSRPRG